MPHVFHILAFDPDDAQAALAQLPQAQAVFALYGSDTRGEPYIGRTPNLRARLEKLLQPSTKHPRRLHLAGLVRQIRWLPTGSEFESLLKQFSLLEEIYGAKALERMHLRAPAFVRFLGGNPYPRVTVTHRPSLREAAWVYGPFPSRAAAERFSEESLKLFLLRRCTDDLAPSPNHPGCIYSEMKMCLAPCYKGCTDERYAEEAAAVEGFLATRGESRLVALRTARDQASAELAFEAAAALHAQVERVEAVQALAAELVRPLSQLRAVILQAAASPDEVAVFLFEDGRLRGPVNQEAGRREQGAVKQGAGNGEQGPARQGPGSRDEGTDGALALLPPGAPAKTPRGVLEARFDAVLAELSAPAPAPSTTVRQGHLALVKRWYYRPEARRAGEIFFPDGEGRWPVKAILRGVGRVAASQGKASQPAGAAPRAAAAPTS